MNISSTFEKATIVRTSTPTMRLATQLRNYVRSAVRSRTENGFSPSKISSGKAPARCLGDAVHHGQFGSGRVMAHWPDGTLLIRFEGGGKSRLVWPSFLN
jgi:hypothetical protein